MEKFTPKDENPIKVHLLEMELKWTVTRGICSVGQPWRTQQSNVASSLFCSSQDISKRNLFKIILRNSSYHSKFKAHTFKCCCIMKLMTFSIFNEVNGMFVNAFDQIAINETKMWLPTKRYGLTQRYPIHVIWQKKLHIFEFES